MTKIIFPDTNVLIHFTPIENWDQEDIMQESEPVIIGITHAIINELDKVKYSSAVSQTTRRRTNDLIKKFSESANHIFNSLQFAFIIQSPDFGEYLQAQAFDKESKDDLFLASVLIYQKENPDDHIIVLTNDFGVRLKCKTRSIAYIAPPAKYLIEETDEVGRLIKKLTAERDHLKNLQPVLTMQFDNQQSYATFIVKEPLDDYTYHVDEKMKEIKLTYPYLTVDAEPTDNAGLITLKLHEKTPDKVAKYNTALDDFYLKYELYLKRIHGMNYKRSLTVELNLELANFGNTPGEDVDVYLHFPDGFTLQDKESYYDKESEPQPPELWRFDMAMPDMMGFLNRSTMFPSFDISSFSIKRTNSYDVRDEYKQVNHHHRYGFKKLFVVYDSFAEAKGFEITYIITAANMVEKSEGSLNINIDRHVWNDEAENYISIKG